MSTLRTDTLQSTDGTFSIDVKDLASGTGSEFVTTANLSDSSDPAKGAALVGFKGRTLAAKLSETRNVKDYGATGNGSTDDTVAIQAAIDSITSLGSVYFPSGNYKITSTLTLPQSKFITFRGEGFRQTMVTSFGGGIPVFNYSRASGQAGSIFEFQDVAFTLDGLGKTAGSSAIRSFGFSDAASDNWLRVYSCAFYGFESGIISKWTGQARVHNCYFQSNKYSINLARGASFWHMLDCMSFDETMVFAQDTTGDAFSNGIVMNGCDHVTGSGTSVFFEGYQSVYIQACGFDLGSGGPTAAWIKGCQDVVIRDCFVSSNPAAAREGIHFDASHTCTVANTTIVNNSVGVRVTGQGGLATKIIIDGCKFDGQDTNDILLNGFVTASKILNNHHVKQMSRTGTNFEIYANTTGTDQNIIVFNTFAGTSYSVTTGGATVQASNIFSCPAG